MAEAYPLYWPEGWKRIDAWRRTDSRFNAGFASSRDFILAELRRLGAKSVVISTNVALRRDGLPLAGQRNPDDPGVAVYFAYKNRAMCFACDRYRKIEENLVAIGKTIEALRGIERWGASDMMERSFQGFTALPEKTGSDWWEVLRVDRSASLEAIESSFRKLARERHPDMGGSHAAMSQLNDARSAAIKERQ